MVIVNGWYAGGGGDVQGNWEVSVRTMGEEGKDFFSNRFLDLLTDGAETTEAYSVAENVDPLLRWWLASWNSIQQQHSVASNRVPPSIGCPWDALKLITLRFT